MDLQELRQRIVGGSEVNLTQDDDLEVVDEKPSQKEKKPIKVKPHKEG